MSEGVFDVWDVPAKGRGEDVRTKPGKVTYWHYGCQGVDDRGWGCGYRTLQTIISWIQHNSRTELTVPTIKKIQEILVEVS